MSWQAFLIAGRFLTRLPFPEPKDYSTKKVAQSAAYYPLIGLLMGTILWLLALSLKSINTEISAFIILSIWVWLSGALHLDGFADTVDAWIGGLGDRQRTLEIMKDPCTGSMAVVALIILLLGKWIAVKLLLSNNQAAFLLWLPAIARCQLAPFFMYTPYARKTGMGVDIAHSIQRPLTWSLIIVILLGSTLHLGVILITLLFTTSVLIHIYWRTIILKRLKGVTGDTAGALVELTELTLLLLLSYFVYR